MGQLQKYIHSLNHTPSHTPLYTLSPPLSYTPIPLHYRVRSSAWVNQRMGQPQKRHSLTQSHTPSHTPLYTLSHPLSFTPSHTPTLPTHPSHYTIGLGLRPGLTNEWDNYKKDDWGAKPWVDDGSNDKMKDISITTVKEVGDTRRHFAPCYYTLLRHHTITHY